MKRIAAEYLYTLERVSPILNGFVEFEDDGTVIRTGQCEDPSSEAVFFKGAVVPGFVNCHCHVELSHLHGKFVKGTGMAGFIDQINALRDWAGREEKVELVRKWMEIMWNRGVSAMADISNDDSSFEVKKSSPMYTRTFLEVFGSEPEMCAGVMREVSELNAISDSMGLDAAPTPHSCYTMSPALLEASAKAGLERGWVSYHSQESMEEEEMIRYGSGAMWDNRKRASMSTPEPTGKSSLDYFVRRLLNIHPAPFNEKILLVHNCCLSQEDIDLARSVMNNVYWAVCPLSNKFIHNTLPPVELMRRNGLKITVGTDSLSSNDDYDILAELRCLQENNEGLSFSELLRWACLNGAEFLGKQDVLGSIEAGKKPGLVLVTGLENGILTENSKSERLI